MTNLNIPAARNKVLVCDQSNPQYVVVVNSDGSINVAGTISVKSAPLVSAGAGQYGLAVGTNTGLTVPAGATMAQITVEGANVRYRDDGGNPTSSVGMLVYQTTSWLYSGPLVALLFTKVSGSPTLDVSYYK